MILFNEIRNSNKSDQSKIKPVRSLDQLKVKPAKSSDQRQTKTKEIAKYFPK